MIPTPQEFQRRRKLLNLTQKQLANRLGVAQSVISKFESEKSMPGYEVLKKLLEGLDQLEHAQDQTAKEIMVKKVKTLKPSNTVKDAIKLFKTYQVSQIPIVDKHLVGIITERTLLGVDDYSLKIFQVMEQLPPLFPQTASKTSIKEILKQYPSILIVGHGKLLGIISRQDVL